MDLSRRLSGRLADQEGIKRVHLATKFILKIAAAKLSIIRTR